MTLIAVGTAFWVSYVLLWFLVVVLFVLMILMFRQFGLAFMRPAQRANMQGLDVGGRAAPFTLVDVSGDEQRITFHPNGAGTGATLILFALPTCEICAGLAGTLASLPGAYPDARFIWVDGSGEHRARKAIEDSAGWIVGSAADDAVHRLWEVSAVPFCFVIGADGKIVAKHLVNRRRDVEFLLGARSKRGMDVTVSS